MRKPIPCKSISTEKRITGLLPVLFACLFIGIGARQAAAQFSTTAYRIRGVVADSVTGKPLASTTVRLHSDADRTDQATITQADGIFRFSVAGGHYHILFITAVGYRSKQIAIVAEDSATQLNNIDTITISPETAVLKEVVVTAGRPLVKQEADKIVYDLQADPDSRSNSVWEMLRKVPFLSVDGQEHLLLKGSSSYRIFLNGKPSGMVERNPGEVLRSIPAATIARIEVITTPSAKYDAEGLAGIINITTTRKIDNGYNGTINLNGKFPAGGPGMGTYFAFKTGKFGMSVLGGGSRTHQPATSSIRNRQTTSQLPTDLDQQSSTGSSSRNSYLGTELSYEIDSLRLLSAQFNYSRNQATGFTNQQALLTTAATMLQQYATANRLQTGGTGIDLGLNYQSGFRKNKSQLLTFSYRYLGYSNRRFEALSVSNLFNYPYTDYRQENEGSAAEHTLQADYVQAVKRLTIEAGAKLIGRINNSDYTYQQFDSAKNRFEPDAARSNQYRNNQYILAAYNACQWLAGSWTLKMGLRLEQTVVAAAFLSVASTVQQHYLSVVPAAVISKKFSNNGQLGLSYTNRIQRPGINQLNPFVDRSNPSFETTGNPALKPATTHVLQLSYTRSKKATVNIALGCMLFNNLVSRFSGYDTTTGITRTTYRNIGTTSIYKTNLYFSYPVGKKWNIRLNSDIRYMKGSINTGKTVLINDGWMAYANLSSSYRPGTSWRINADLTVNSANISGIQSSQNGFAGFQTNLQKELAKGKLTLAVSVSNPFSKYRYSRDEVIDPGFIQVTTSQLYYRSFGISVNYRFGKLKEAVRKNKRGINNDDRSE